MTLMVEPVPPRQQLQRKASRLIFSLLELLVVQDMDLLDGPEAD
jgi:hypothetical protein